MVNGKDIIKYFDFMFRFFHFWHNLKYFCVICHSHCLDNYYRVIRKTTKLIKKEKMEKVGEISLKIYREF